MIRRPIDVNAGAMPGSKSSFGSRACPCETDSGFTLVEMLVALTLLAFISLMASTFIGQLRIWNTRLSGDAQRQALLLAARHIERTIEDALMLPIDLNDNDGRQYFLGTANQMTFVAHTRTGLLESALRGVRFGIDETGGRRDLHESLSVRRFGSSAEPEDQKVSIAADVDRLEIEYLQYGADGSAQWASNWTAGRSLPLAVRFELTAIRDGKPVTASGVAHIAIATAQPNTSRRR